MTFRKNAFYLYSIYCSMAGILAGVLATTFGLDGEFDILSFGRDYNTIGYALRGFCLVAGLVAFFFAIKSLINKENLRAAIISLALALCCLFWEIAVVLAVIAMLLLILFAIAYGM